MRTPLPPERSAAALVWVRSNGKLWPQLWRTPFVGNGPGEQMPDWVAAYPVNQATADLKLDLDTLAGLFPAPPEAAERRIMLLPPMEPEPEEPTHEPRAAITRVQGSDGTTSENPT